MMVPELPILLPFWKPQSHIKPYAMGQGTLETVWIEDYQAPQVVPAFPVDRAFQSLGSCPPYFIPISFGVSPMYPLKLTT